ncbi:hypothetical protein [Reyranella sp.]|uniref:hypothetical protein n=1 Tax=Reyranella sp. TaxID=1929291 RepID=UPI003D0A380A
MLRLRFWTVAIASLAICSCAGVDGVEGPPPNIERLSGDPIARANFQTNYIRALRINSDLPPDSVTSPAPAAEWKLISRAGIDQIDEVCNNYLASLYRFNANQKAARQGLAAATATTAVIMGFAGATGMAIGITAAALGLSMSLFDAGTNSVLFTVEASAVRNVVQESRARYIVAMSSNPPTTRPDTMIALRGYLSLCTPATIEANINNAANGSRNSVTTPIEKDGVAAAALAAPAMTTIARAQSVTRSSVTDAPPPIPVPARPAGATAAEASVTRADLTKVQAALGVKADGDFGTDTRNAIVEFGRGMKKRLSTSGPADENANELVGSVRALLYSIAAVPMPPMFGSAYERAYLGEPSTYVRPDPIRLNSLLERIPAPSGKAYPDTDHNSDADMAKKLSLMRESLGGPLTSTKHAALPN